MLRLRARVVALLLAGARFLLGPDEVEEDVDPEFGLPPGHPVVVRSALADQMVQAGRRPVRQVAPAVESPLAGSLAARRARTST